MKAAPKCLGVQENHHQGAITSTSLKIQAWFKVDTDGVMHGVTMKNYEGKPIVTSVSFHILKFILSIGRP